MLTIEIKINGRFIAGAKVQNITNEEAVSDYAVEAVETPSEITGMDRFHSSFPINGHRRKQSVWKLVERVCHGVTLAQRRRPRDALPESPGEDS